jgi:hypothetical protein
MALATHPDRTILLLVGEVDIPTNLSGRNFVRLDGTAEQLSAFAARLERAGCPVDRTGNAWLDTGAFEALGALSRRPATLASAEPHATAQEADSTLRIAINQLLEELEDIHRHVVDDSHDYWAKHVLPTSCWKRYGRLLALHNDAHAALRAAYLEADRLARCVAKNGRTYGPMGDYDEHYTVDGCEPDRWHAAYEQARRHLELLRPP